MEKRYSHKQKLKKKESPGSYTLEKIKNWNAEINIQRRT